MTTEALIFGFVFSTGLAWLGGWLVGRERPRRKPYVEPKPICEGCHHHESFHAQNHGHCQQVGLVGYGGREPTCSCQRYTGPEPLPTYLPERELP